MCLLHKLEFGFNNDKRRFSYMNGVKDSKKLHNVLIIRWIVFVCPVKKFRA